jgi:hypothetical protein
MKPGAILQRVVFWYWASIAANGTTPLPVLGELLIIA